MNESSNFAIRKSIISKTCSIALGLTLFSLTSCGMKGGQGPMLSTTATATGAAANLTWDPVNDSTIVGYYIHYGKQSPNQSGSCTYKQVQFVPSPQGSVTDLDPESIYYFAVSAYNGIEGNCSNEVYIDTDPATLAHNSDSHSDSHDSQQWVSGSM